MISKSFCWFLALGVGLAPIAASAASGSGNKFTVSEATQVPGQTLDPGAYSIHIVDHLSERYVVRVDDLKDNTHSTFLAIANPAIPKPASSGKVMWQDAPGGKEYMRGWLFKGEPSVLEFVFPKDEAVDIAKSNEAKVPAIDPASEGRPAAIKGLSQSDLELVNLWLLSSTHVGPGDAAGTIQAEHYKQIASASQKPKIGKLPQTGSNLPWIGLTAALSLMAALFMRFYRPVASPAAKS
jgi:LPXTG-motif cell wall-anchored protein